MSKLQEYNGRFCESEYEYAFITLFGKRRLAVLYRGIKSIGRLAGMFCILMI